MTENNMCVKKIPCLQYIKVNLEKLFIIFQVYNCFVLNTILFYW